MYGTHVHQLRMDINEVKKEYDLFSNILLHLDNTPIKVNNELIENVEGYYAYLGKRTKTKRYNEESWQAGRHTPNTEIASEATLPCDCRDRCTTPVCCQLSHNSIHPPNKLAAAQTKMKKVCSTSHRAYMDGKNSIRIRDRTKVIEIISNGGSCDNVIC